MRIKNIQLKKNSHPGCDCGPVTSREYAALRQSLARASCASSAHYTGLGMGAPVTITTPSTITLTVTSSRTTRQNVSAD